VTDVSEQDLRGYRVEADQTQDEVLSPNAGRPAQQRAKVLSVRLTPDEFEELSQFAGALDLPASALVRGWILDQLRTSSESPITTVERIAHELEQLRRQLAA